LSPDAAPHARSRRFVGLVARFVGVGLAIWLVASQVRWDDSLTLRDGTVRSGDVRTTATGFDVESGGATTRVPLAEVATERYGGRELPKVTRGLRTLAGRLGNRVGTVALVVLAFVALAIGTAWRWRWLVEALGLVLRAVDAIRYTFYGIFFNLVVPGATGGDVVKAYYAARRTGVPTKAVVSVLVDRIVGLFALVLFASAILFSRPDRAGWDTPRTFCAVVLAAGIGGGALVLSRRLRRALGLSALFARLPFQHVWREVDAAFRLYRGRPGALALGVVVSLGNHAGTAILAFVLARALGLEVVALSDCLALVPVVSLLSAIPLLPGGWGVGELAFAFFFGPVGVPPSEAVALSVVLRLAILTSGLPGGVWWLASHETTRRGEMAAVVAAAEDAVGG
jgi:uncharacterized membrane protein YbhN (UPF0104 family)